MTAKSEAINVNPLLDPLPKAGQVSGKRHWVQASQPRFRRGFLARFSQAEDSPSFYLSLSDLMSLLVVFFVLIFSLSSQGIKTSQREAQHLVRAVVPPPVTPVATEDPWPAPTPVSKEISQGLAAVAGIGSPDPGLMAEPAPEGHLQAVPNQPPDGKPTANEPPVRRMFINQALLALVSSGSASADGILPQSEASLGDLLARVEKGVSEKDGLEVEKGRDRLILRLPEDITFDLGRAEIKPAMRQVLGRLAAALSEHSDYRAVVTGHTDDLPISTPIFASNWELSGARAAAVARALIESGLDPKLFTIRGLADTQPRMPNTTPLNRQMNRRVEIELRGNDSPA
jgi:chemotaxis protein MotB